MEEIKINLDCDITGEDIAGMRANLQAEVVKAETDALRHAHEEGQETYILYPDGLVEVHQYTRIALT